MVFLNKGQSQVVTALMLTAIMIVLVSAAYLWGLPLIQKQQDVVTVNNAEKFFKELDEKIRSVATNGGRERIDSVDIPGTLTLTDSGLDDEIRLEFESEGSVLANDVDIYLVGDAREQAPITDPAGVVTVRTTPTGGKYNVRFVLKYRELLAAANTYRIDIEIGGRTTVGKGLHNVIISEAESETLRGAGFAGKDLVVTKVNLRFE